MVRIQCRAVSFMIIIIKVHQSNFPFCGNSLFSDLFSKSSPKENGLFESEGTSFGKKGGLFSGGGNLFDDVEADKVHMTIIMDYLYLECLYLSNMSLLLILRMTSLLLTNLKKQKKKVSLRKVCVFQYSCVLVTGAFD